MDNLYTHQMCFTSITIFPELKLSEADWKSIEWATAPPVKQTTKYPSMRPYIRTNAEGAVSSHIMRQLSIQLHMDVIRFKLTYEFGMNFGFVVSDKSRRCIYVRMTLASLDNRHTHTFGSIRESQGEFHISILLKADYKCLSF